ncbi:unnamed protein product, partial [Urochloa humidicola]
DPGGHLAVAGWIAAASCRRQPVMSYLQAAAEAEVEGSQGASSSVFPLLGQDGRRRNDPRGCSSGLHQRCRGRSGVEELREGERR